MTTRNPHTLMAMSVDDTFDFLFKIVLIGDCGVGKSCVVERFKSGNFVERHGNTIGVDFSMKSVNIEGKKIKVSGFGRKLKILEAVETGKVIVSCHFSCKSGTQLVKRDSVPSLRATTDQPMELS